MDSRGQRTFSFPSTSAVQPESTQPGRSRSKIARSEADGRVRGLRRSIATRVLCASSHPRRNGACFTPAAAEAAAGPAARFQTGTVCPTGWSSRRRGSRTSPANGRRRTPSRPARGRRAAAETAWCRVQVVVENCAAGREVREPSLFPRRLTPVIVPAGTLGLGHFGHLRLRIRSGLLRAVADQRRDAQPEFERGRSRSRCRLRALWRPIRSRTPSSGSPQNSWTSASVAETRSPAAEAPPKYSLGCLRSP